MIIDSKALCSLSRRAVFGRLEYTRGSFQVNASTIKAEESAQKGLVFELQQIANPFDRMVGSRVPADLVSVVCVVPLFGENGGETLSPDLLDRCQDPEFVVDEHIMISRITLLHVVELVFFVHVNQNFAIEGIPQSGSLDLAGLKHDISVGKDHRGSPFLDVLDRIKRVWKQTIGERITNQE